jgi:superfamily I DNA/RNA helicase
MAWNDDLHGPSLEFAGHPAARVRALAGPGTGKTTALLRRIARILEEGAQPREIFVVTFARTAAEDLKAALQRLGDNIEVTARTLHSYCFSTLASEGVLAITGRTPRILLEFERDHLLKDLVGPFPPQFTERLKLTQSFEAAWAREQTERPGEPVEGLDQAFQDALLDSLRWHRCMLIGEVVPSALNYLRTNPEAPERTTYSYVLVDEYQDLNKAEQTVVDLLCDQADLAVIGDDDQSIYGFKWANPEGIRTFPATHEGTADVQFTECRRCPRSVVRMAQTLIERNPGRARGPLQPRADNCEGEVHHIQWTSLEAEAEGIASFLQQQIQAGVNPGRCLVLTNSRRIGYGIRNAVRQRGIEIRSFFREEAVETEAAQEKLTLLTLLASPDDRVSLRCGLAFDSTTRREGPYRRVLATARADGSSVGRVLERMQAEELDLPHCAGLVERWQHLNAQLDELRPLADHLPTLADALFPAAGAGEEDDFAIIRPVALAAAAEAESLEELNDVLRYRLAQPEVPLETPFARVMSFHKSKGLAAEVVALAGLIEGLIPRIKQDLTEAEQQAALEEQRRLFFVGMTRTTRVLVLSSYSQLPFVLCKQLNASFGRRVRGTDRVVTIASRFLGELGPELPDGIRGDDWRF